MSIVQISRIQVRTGNIADLPQLADGEFGWADDTKQLFIGNNPDTIGQLPDNTEILTQYSNLGNIGKPGGANTDVQYNNGGVFGGSDLFTWDNANGVLNVVGSVQGSVVLSENGLFVNANNVANTYTLPDGFNAVSAGPITISPGANIIINPGSRWTVV